MSMSRKNYVAFAAAIKDAYSVCTNESEKQGVKRVADRIADVCRYDNCNFNYSRFEAACGFEDAQP